MVKLSRITAALRKGLSDTRIRILVLIAAFGTFAALYAVVDDSAGKSSIYYHDRSYGYTDFGIRLEASSEAHPVEPAAEPEIRLDINSASAYELADTLPGIGEKKAQAIIEYREITGGFTSVDELMEVGGIGEKLFARIQPYCYVTAPSDSDADE